MNNKEDNFESRVGGQPLRPVPTAWRAEILAAARAAQAGPQVVRVADRSLLSTLNSQLSTLLWPHPKAWAGLAAVWGCIFILNFSTREKSLASVAEKSTPASPEVVVELRKQQKLYAELMGINEPREADRPKVFAPSPRSGLAQFLMT